jgi:hypothetical protein
VVFITPLQDTSIKYEHIIAWNYKMIITDNLENVWEEGAVNSILLERLRINTEDFSDFWTTFRYESGGLTSQPPFC